MHRLYLCFDGKDVQRVAVPVRGNDERERTRALRRHDAGRGGRFEHDLRRADRTVFHSPGKTDPFGGDGRHRVKGNGAVFQHDGIAALYGQGRAHVEGEFLKRKSDLRAARSRVHGDGKFILPVLRKDDLDAVTPASRSFGRRDAAVCYVFVLPDHGLFIRLHIKHGGRTLLFHGKRDGRLAVHGDPRNGRRAGGIQPYAADDIAEGAAFYGKAEHRLPAERQENGIPVYDGKPLLHLDFRFGKPARGERGTVSVHPRGKRRFVPVLRLRQYIFLPSPLKERDAHVVRPGGGNDDGHAVRICAVVADRDDAGRPGAPGEDGAVLLHGNVGKIGAFHLFHAERIALIRRIFGQDFGDRTEIVIVFREVDMQSAFGSVHDLDPARGNGNTEARHVPGRKDRKDKKQRKDEHKRNDVLSHNQPPLNR